MVLGMVGPFGDSNFGDYAMLVNNIYSIQPEELVVFTYNASLLDTLAGTYLKEYSISSMVVKTTYEYKAEYSNGYKIQYDDEVLIPTQILHYINDVQKLRDAVCKIDMLFVCGGGYFNRFWNGTHRKGKLLSILGTMLIANEEHKKIIFGGNTFGPFDESSEFYKSFFGTLQNTFYAARDDVYSRINMRQLGMEDEMALLPDDLYFLDEGLEAFKADIGFKLPEKYMILELYCSLDELENNMEEVKRFVELVNRKYELKVLFVSLDKGFGGEKQGEKLKDVSNILVWQFENQPYRKIEDVLFIVRHARFVLCQRYHLFLVAIANNIPAYQILKSVCGDKRYYYCKTNGLLRQVYFNQIYREDNYFAQGISEAFNKITAAYEEIIHEQQRLFNCKKQSAEERMKQSRMKYIERYLKV